MKHGIRRTTGAAVLALAGLALLAAGCATASGAARGGADDPIAGTWRGGSSYAPGGDPFKDLGVRYVLTLMPLGGGRYGALWEGSYVLPPGYARMTQYSGEFARRDEGVYECVGMALFNSSAAFPPDALPQVWAIHGKAELVDKDTLKVTYDAFEAQEWKATPFVDPPLFKPVPTPIVEVYKRFTVGAKK